MSWAKEKIAAISWIRETGNILGSSDDGFGWGDMAWGDNAWGSPAWIKVLRPIINWSRE